MSRKPLSGKRVAFGFAGLLLFLALMYLGPTPPGKGDLALRILATALSILAGILLAVITLLGDPRSLYPGNWRVASAHRRQIRVALNRAAALFWMYLGTIAIGLAAVLLEAYEPQLLAPCLVGWLKHLAMCFGSVALLWSFWLPASIRRAQLDRLDEEVERRKQGDSSPASD